MGTVTDFTPSDLDFESLADPKLVSAARQTAEDTYRDLGSEEIAELRRRSKSDLFFFSYGVLGYDLLSPRLHGHLCRWLERTRRTQYRVLLLPRGHYKSTVLTISGSVQMALPNDAGVQEHPWSLGTNLKLLLAHENRESASRFLYEVSEAFLRKPLMLALFPECIPDRKRQRINKWELELPRTSHSKEPTFDTIGAGGAAQGRHYNRLVLDDLIGEAARESATVMNTVLNWFDNATSLLTRPKLDGFDVIGTRWSFKDVYQHAMEMYGVDKELSILRCMKEDEVPDGIAAAYLRGAEENGEPIFPEEFPPEFLERLKKNPMVYAAQYANNPLESGLTEFDVGWLKYYNKRGGYLYVFDGDGTRRVDIYELDRVLMVDPSMGERNESDESGLVLTGTDHLGNIYILETIKERLKPPDLIDAMFGLYFKWSPRLISFEDVAFSGLFAYWFDEKCREMGVSPSIFRYKPGGRRSKRARILGMANYFADGRIYIDEDMAKFKQEYEWFGITDSEHLLDAFAQGPEIWRYTRTREEAEKAEKRVKAIIDQRSALTGY